MKRISILLAVTAAPLGASARTWTLDECVNHAIDHNLTVRRQQVEQLNAEQQVISAKDAVLPQISGSASQSWNFGRGLTASNTYADRNTTSFGANIGLQLPLFNGLQTVRQIEYAKTSLTAMVENLEAAKDDVTLRVMAQYLQALYCRELEAVAQSQLELTEEELNRRNALLEAGKIPEADMLDASSQAADARRQLVVAQSDTRMALLDLAQMLRLTNDEFADFDIAPLQSDERPTLPDPQSVYDSALGINHSLAASRLQIDAADRQIKLAQTGYIPRLSFNAGLGSNYYKISGMPNDAFGPQMRHNFSQYVGFSLSVPIFDGMTTRNNVRRARLQRLSADLTYETQKDNLYKAISESYYQAVGARERLQASVESTVAAEAALDAVREKYNVGRATPTDFETARNRYVQSRSEQVSARYELLLRARILDFYAHGRSY